MSLAGSYRATGGKPQWEYSVNYTETGRTGSSASYRVTMSVRMTTTNGYYGYGISANCTINGS
ncbi:hypothetical protein, partial [Cetobacterium sp.]|uniref:hypothetical protein n=1 Tax=Cetobacterium sp. TaxID=2071632 RepID=UPI003EE6F6FA